MHKAKKPTRTIFVVGDEKQSIYRFQGADVQNFIRTRSQLEHYLKQRSYALETVRLARSFRSTPAILALVDAVFSQDATRQGLGDAAIAHTAFREAKPGTVEVWRWCRTTKKKNKASSPSLPPIRTVRTPRRSLRSASPAPSRIGCALAVISLPKSDRSPLGIFSFWSKNAGNWWGSLRGNSSATEVPIAGVDRLVLTDHIAVKDMLALVQFLLLPEDDLTLACLLRSPLYDIDEQTLFTLAHDRGHASLCGRGCAAWRSLPPPWPTPRKSWNNC
jgi:ATP-dependent helicase/nuclease subunit A